MKSLLKQSVAVVMLGVCSTAYGQVGIKTTTPHASADLELGSANKTLYLNRVANPVTDILNPQPGMMVYDVNAKCVKIYQGTPPQWSYCLTGSSGVAVGSVTTLDCGAVIFDPASATQGQAYNGTLTVPYTGGNGGAYDAQSFTAGDFTVSLPAGNFQSGDGTVAYSITGTPTTAGTTTIDITLGGQSCNGLTLTVNNPAPPSNLLGTGSLSGRMCFDVVETNDGGECGTLTSRAAQKADFAETNPADPNYAQVQTYTFKPSGTVSNVRFVFVNTGGQVIQSITPDADYSGTLTSAQTATATVVFYDNLNTTAAGLSRNNALLGDIYVVYNDGTEDKQLKLTAKVQDCACCGAFIAPGVWKEFMCHNLGADTTADPFTPSWRLNGAYIGWGRRGPNTTGDSSIDWQTAPNDPTINFAAAPTDTTTNGGLISGWNNSGLIDATLWNSGDQSNPVKTVNDPCPVGYRVPTQNEMQGLINNNTTSTVGTFSSNATTYDNYSSGTFYGSFLYLPMAGTRASANTGRLFNRGASQYYWTSTRGPIAGGGTAYFLFRNTGTFASHAVNYNNLDNTYGNSIRCIAE